MKLLPPAVSAVTVRRAQRLGSLVLLAGGVPLVATACGEIRTNNKVEVAPIEVKPIQITVDVNLRIDRSLDDFFSYQRAAGPAVVVPPPATGPTTMPR